MLRYKRAQVPEVGGTQQFVGHTTGPSQTPRIVFCLESEYYSLSPFQTGELWCSSNEALVQERLCSTSSMKVAKT